MKVTSEPELAEELAEVARSLQAEGSAQETLQKMVELAAATIDGCDYAGVSLVVDGEVHTPAATGDVPASVDRIQYDTGEGPCLDAIREHGLFETDDLRAERRWPRFSPRAAEETGVRSMLSFRLFLAEDTLGALNLYSGRVGAFGEESRRMGAVFAAHAAVALEAAQGQERVVALEDDLEGSRHETQRFAQQAELALALQHSMLPGLPDLGPLEVAARYVPAMETAEVGGDWYDAFRLSEAETAIVIGDLAGHDIAAAVAMGQARSILRTLAVDRREPPGELLGRFDAVLARLLFGWTATCVYAQLGEQEGTWSARVANAGHPPPLRISGDGARYVEAPADTLLGAGVERPRRTVAVALPPGTTLLLYTDGLIERRDRGIDDGLAELRDAAAALAGRSVDELCDALLARFAAEPADDVCLLAVRTPGAPDER